MPTEKNINFTENPLAAEAPDRYVRVNVHVGKVVKSWKQSLFSFEWLTPDGDIKHLTQLSEAEQEKRQIVEQSLGNGTPLAMPILGIGIMDNIEIGCGRAEFLTLAARGVEIIPVHIPKSCESDFKPFLAVVK
jgi:hypothetical protein